MYIETNAQLRELCQRILPARIMSIDTEFVREKTYGAELSLVQLSCEYGTAAIDAMSPGITDLSPLAEVLAQPTILKIFHSGRQDIEIFYKLFGQVPAPVFDTQVAAAFCGFPDGIGYARLAKSLLRRTIDKSLQHSDWKKRPLNPDQISYALSDAIYLLQLYDQLMARLKKRRIESWAEEEMRSLLDPAIYQNKPEEAWQRLKIESLGVVQQSVVKALATWRELLAQQSDLPRQWVMTDETLFSLSDKLPSTRAELEKITALTKSATRNIDGLLQAVAEGKAAVPGTAQAKENTDNNLTNGWPTHEGAMLDVLAALVRHTSAQNLIAEKMIATKDDLQTLLQTYVTSKKTDTCRLLQGWRAQLIGNDLLALLKGEKMLKIDNAMNVGTAGKMVLVDVG